MLIAWQTHACLLNYHTTLSMVLLVMWFGGVFRLFEWPGWLLIVCMFYWTFASLDTHTVCKYFIWSANSGVALNPNNNTSTIGKHKFTNNFPRSFFNSICYNWTDIQLVVFIVVLLLNLNEKKREQKQRIKQK